MSKDKYGWLTFKHVLRDDDSKTETENIGFKIINNKLNIGIISYLKDKDVKDEKNKYFQCELDKNEMIEIKKLIDKYLGG